MKFTVILPLIAAGLIFAGCTTDDSAVQSSLYDGSVPGVSGARALLRRTGGYEKTDALSSASILRAGRGRFGYVGQSGTGDWHLRLVDVEDPETVVLEKQIPGGANVALWTTGHDGRIIMVTANEFGYEAFLGRSLVVYDRDLRILGQFPFGTEDDAVPLHHRDPALAVTEKYAIAGWDSEEGGGTYISIYALDGSKKGHIKTSAAPVSFTADMMAFAAKGDYIIAGDSAKTKVFRIDDSGANITLAEETSLVLDVGAHWMLDNGSYVLEPLINKGTVQVWKWSDTGKPAKVGSSPVSFGGVTTGSVQAISFDNSDPAKAYFFGRVVGNAGAASNVGDVYSINLATAAATKLFNIGGYYYAAGRGGNPPAAMGKALSGIWTIQVEKSGNDTYYILGGAIGGVGAAGDTNYRADTNGVLVIKNPGVNATINPSTATANDPAIVATLTLTDFPTPVRTMKTFVSGGKIYYAAKNYTGNPFYSSVYLLRLMNVN